MTSCYRCGDLVDLCRGPHLPNTNRAKAFMVTKNSAAYWLGDQNLDSLQRLYGIAFPNDKLLKEYKKFQEEAAKRDHRNIGKQQELMMFHPVMSPGCCFWFPLGTRVYNKLMDFMRSEYRLRGFQEVVTPNMYDARLFLASGHYQNYKDDMYSLDVEKQEWMLKPMNCPGHFVMFDARVRSYKELPLRYADFGVLHRNEASGALTGLTRVRRFQQDDAHIFCRPDQIKSEVASALDFLDFVYKIFGFKASYALSTRPKKALGSKEIWDNAEVQLKAALDQSGREWSLNPGDGAFYGPKIDIRLQDAMKRKHQCGTIQLDFNGPIRFNLQYRKEGVEETEDTEEKGEFKGAEEKNAKGAMSVVFKRIPIGGSAAVFKALKTYRPGPSLSTVPSITKTSVEEALVAAKTKVTFLEVETVKGLPVKKDVTTKTIDPYFAAYIKDVSKAFFGK
ncbi:Threonine--tRNA ligase 1 [Durusdinium trenchii]|uniref:threonine--tRNA ligase n=1 Tax=Durusdinium trenchii TaxID=1381693 RepID=A0ABP0SKD5_9DINO